MTTEQKDAGLAQAQTMADNEERRYRERIGEEEWARLKKIEEEEGLEAAQAAARELDKRLAAEEPQQPEPRREIVPLTADTGSVTAIIPRTTDEAGRFASAIIASGIVPVAFKLKDAVRDEEGAVIIPQGAPNKPLIVMGILKSMELGLPPITGLSYLLPINDRFAIWGDGAVALAQPLIAKQERRTFGPAPQPGQPLGEWSEEYGVEVLFWRKGQESPYVGRYSVGDAKRANLWMNNNKKPWVLYPERMLFNRARAFALRDGFADALSGLSIAEEVRDHIEEPKDGGELKREERKAKLFAPEEE